MIRTVLSVVALAAVMLSRGAWAADITVTVTGIASAGGTVRAALHDGAEGFPGDREMVQGVLAPATPGNITLVFRDVRPGRYAIAAFHDKDNDGTLTTNFIGMPLEPYGFSRDARGAFGPPSFGEAAFDIGDGDAAITLGVR